MIKRIKTHHLYFLLVGIMLLVRPNIAQAKAIEKGNPVAYYDYDKIILSDDTVIDILLRRLILMIQHYLCRFLLWGKHIGSLG